MRRLVIAVDCDDVLVPTAPFMVRAYNQLYGTSATLAQLNDPSFDIWQADEALQNERWAQLIEVEGYKELRPSAEEVTILKKIAAQHELHLVTARKEHERAFTQALLEQHLLGVFTTMEFVGWDGSKGQICRKIGADVLIDDNMHHLQNALQFALPAGGAILFGDYPWNEAHRSHDDIVHCIDWTAVDRVITALSERA